MKFNGKNYYPGLPAEVGIGFSQLGEDSIVSHVFSHWFELNRPGVYCDVGCFHPVQYSNTKLLNLSGWTGVNIDANTQTIEEFKKNRDTDINLNFGVGKTAGKQIFYEFLGAAYNTFSYDLMLKYVEQGQVLKKEVEVQVLPLSDLLSLHAPMINNIDYLSIDIEGYDHEAIESFDFKKFKPRLISIELQGLDLYNINENITVNFLSALGYKLFSYTIITAHFVRWD